MDAKDTIVRLYDKYKLDILSVINAHLLIVNSGKTYEDIYTAKGIVLRKTLYNYLKDVEIKAKGKELNGEGMKLVTKERIEEWLNKGESVVGICRKYVGVREDVMGEYIKSLGIGVRRQAKDVVANDEDVRQLVNSMSGYDILLLLEATLVKPREKRERRMWEIGRG